ncbi:MAG: DUF6057 family protein [Phycisphaerales bacterium]
MAKRKALAQRKQKPGPPADKESGDKPRSVVSPARFRPGRGVVFFAFFYVYFAVAIDVRLFYHCCGFVDNFPCFYKGWDFFRGFLAYPGGLVEYLCAWLAQSFYSPWLGAGVMTGKAWVLFACTDYVLKALGALHLRGLRFLGPLLLVAVYSQYGFPFLTTMALLAALLGICLYLKLRSGDDVRTIGLFVVLCLLLYVAAAGTSLVFVALCTAYEGLLRRRGRLALIELGLGVVTPCGVGVLGYGVRPLDAYCRLLPLSWDLTSHSAFRIMLDAVWALYLFLPFVVVAVGAWRLVGGQQGGLSSKLKATTARAGRLLDDDSRGVAGLNLPTLTLLVATAVALLLYRAPARKDILRADYFSRQGMWDQVLELGRRGPYRYTVCHAVDRALCRLDRLGDEMFRFPQRPVALLLTDRSAEPVWQKFDICMDLGLINQAENSLLMCTEIYGERPLLLHRLATIHRIKGNVATARLYLEALAKVPFWGATARRDLARLQADPDLSEDEQIQHWRGVMLKADSVRDVDVLTQLLMENPTNRTAYQYVMASFLFAKDLDNFVRIFETRHRLNFSRIPKHYEEALLLSRTLKRQPVDVPGQTISPRAKAQLQEFLQAFQQAGGEKSAARSAIRK